VKAMELRERVEQARRAHPFFRLGVPILCAVYLAVVKAVAGHLGPEHVALVVLVMGFAFWSDRSRNLARIAYPFLLWALVYDSMRWYADYIRSPVIHLHEPYSFDLRFFGIHTARGVLTPNEYFQMHPSKVLDLLCGLAYTPFFFIGESVVLALYLFVKGHSRLAERFAWVFVWSNFLGFSLYYLYPAAPPWYVATHGFVADLSVHASPAGALRFDQLIGLPIMQGFYGKSADVFGAIPSLHVVYPMLALIYGFRLPRFRVVAVVYFLLVCFSAVYLDHHYLVDLFVGYLDALLVMAIFRGLFGPAETIAATSPEPQPNRVPA
jgi:inositol phosphorylceramide synthase catalytic subunit